MKLMIRKAKILENIFINSRLGWFMVQQEQVKQEQSILRNYLMIRIFFLLANTNAAKNNLEKNKFFL